MFNMQAPRDRRFFFVNKIRTMNYVTILVQSKDDPKNLLDSIEKASKFQNGLTVIFIENGTAAGQIAVELIFKGIDLFGKETIVGVQVTENNFEGVTGAFIGARMRFNRIPEDQFIIVRQYVKEKARNFLKYLAPYKREIVEVDVKKFFGL